jgi:NADPH:quinone reductase-like Zn-dependent oxidoreductase
MLMTRGAIAMLAVYAKSTNVNDPLEGLVVGDAPQQEVPDDWVAVCVKAASINHHDVWSLKGVGLSDKLVPMILGCDAAGVDEDGNEVIVHALVGDANWRGDETLDPRRTLFSEKYPGTFAETIRVPRRNLVVKPKGMSFEEAACLPTAWLTAYRMLFTQSGLKPGDSVLVQGAGGGVATALIALATAAGMRVLATSRSSEKRARAIELGALDAYEPGARLPHRVDAVMETVGAATWAHSVKSLRPGGTIVTCGATSGDAPPAELTRVFFLQLRVQGSTMGTRAELEALTHFMVATGVRPQIDRVLDLSDARAGFKAVIDGDLFGKVVLTNN